MPISVYIDVGSVGGGDGASNYLVNHIKNHYSNDLQRGLCYIAGRSAGLLGCPMDCPRTKKHRWVAIRGWLAFAQVGTQVGNQLKLQLSQIVLGLPLGYFMYHPCPLFVS